MAEGSAHESVAPEADDESRPVGERRTTPPPPPGGPGTRGEDFLYHLYRGSELVRDSRLSEAHDELESALQLTPRAGEGQDLLAVVYFRLGLYGRAMQILEQLLRDNPRDASLRLNLALCQLKTGNFERARDALLGVVAQHPDHKRAWGYLGLAYLRLGLADDARRAFARGGHKKAAARLLGASETLTEDERERAVELPEVAREAEDVLDAGESAFALAEPLAHHAEIGAWHAIEFGSVAPPARSSPLPPPAMPDGATAPRSAVTAPPPPDAEDVVRRESVRAGEEHAITPRSLGRIVSDTAPGENVPPMAIRSGWLHIALREHGSERVAFPAGAVRAMVGAIDALPISRADQELAELIESSGDINWDLAAGHGDMLLEARRSYGVTCVELAEHDGLVVDIDRVLAVEPDVVVRGPGSDPDTPTKMVRLRGPGHVALIHRGTLTTLRARGEAGVRVTRSLLIGTSDSLTLESGSDRASDRLRFIGEGFLLIEGRHT